MTKVNEIWKAVVGFEGLYEVSNLGKVRSLKNKGSLTPKELKLQKCYNGYRKVSLYSAETAKQYFVHRLVAEAFLPNTNGYSCVNHKDENRQNNSVDNLEWCTYGYNNSFGERVRKTINSRNLHGSYGAEKPVIKYSLCGEFLKEYKSISDASRENKISTSRISRCCRRIVKCKTAGGYVWKYSEDRS